MFPLESFASDRGARQFSTTPPGDPLNRWKPPGTAITSPADLSQIELVRRDVATRHELGEAVPAHIFLWRTGEPTAPYLTKIGGTPHREASLPWPIDEAGKPYTFVAQFCFLDSSEIVPAPLPGEVMLVFFQGPDSNNSGPPHGLHLEWSNRKLLAPMQAGDCPPPRFPVPRLAGVMHRSADYPESSEIFRQEGHFQWPFFAVSKASKIGRAAFTIHDDPRRPGEEFLCTLNSLEPNRKHWLFLDVEHLTGSEYTRVPDAFSNTISHNWGVYQMMFGDRGCTYFLIDADGQVRWDFQSY